MSSDQTLDFTDMGKRTFPNTILVYFQKFGLIVDNNYALLWAPNAYGVILMRIFTPCLVFQCVFNNFQCVITLLRALSVALCIRLRFISSIFIEYSKQITNYYQLANHLTSCLQSTRKVSKAMFTIL